MKLSEKKCIPCERNDLDPLSPDEAIKLFTQHESDLQGWKLNESCTRMICEKIFPDFVTAMNFVNRVAHIAESEGHHPNISIEYNKIQLDLWTHSIGGLSENDFIVASRINEMN